MKMALKTAKDFSTLLGKYHLKDLTSMASNFQPKCAWHSSVTGRKCKDLTVNIAKQWFEVQIQNCKKILGLNNVPDISFKISSDKVNVPCMVYYN
jgi:hypothetical protein